MQISDLSVLLVEPSNSQTTIITRLLHDAGVSRVERVATGAEALAIVRVRDLHLVISRLYLCDMDGADLAREVNSLERALRPAFVLISAETNEARLEPLRQSGAAAIVHKPFDMHFLREALNSVLDHLEPGQLHIEGRDVDELRLLVVDDATAIRRFLSQLLHGMGIEHISEAADGADAIPLIGEEYFDLVITDLHMPKVNGVELVRYIRNESQQRSVPVIMVTSDSDASRIEEARQAGVSEFLHKPFDARALKRYIQRLLASD